MVKTGTSSVYEMADSPDNKDPSQWLRLSSTENSINSMVNDNISNRSINRKVSSLKSFYNFLIKTDTINSSPLKAHTPLKQ